MHEAGIARAVADQIRDRQLPPNQVRLLVTGGHGEPDDFDAALRMHLLAALPGLDADAIQIQHQPTARMCPSCAVPFDGIRALDPCPSCGSSGIPMPVPEQIDLEVLAAPVGTRGA